MIGLEGHTSLLTNISAALQSSSLYFGQDARPGNTLDYLEANSSHRGDKRVPLWDVWHCEALAEDRRVSVSSEGGDALVLFHKLNQWLAYSLIEPEELGV